MEQHVELKGLTMAIDIKFNRMLTEIDYVVPGGYEIVFSGKSMSFDFRDYYGTIDKDDPTVLHCELEHPDFDAFEDFRSVTTDDLRNVNEITDCYVYIGEECYPELTVVEILAITFSTDFSGPINLRDDVIQKYNIALKRERK